MILRMKLKPIKVGKYWETVSIETKVLEDENWYPMTYVHIDTFYEKGGNDIYNSLNAGNTVCVDANLVKYLTE